MNVDLKLRGVLSVEIIRLGIKRKNRRILSSEFGSFTPHFPAGQHFSVVVKSPSDVTEIARRVATIEDRDMLSVPQGWQVYSHH